MSRGILIGIFSLFDLDIPTSSQVPRPSCVVGRENEGSKTEEFFFNGREWQNCSLKVEKGAHNWNCQHVNSNFFSDKTRKSALGAAVELLFSLRPICHFHFQHFSTVFLAESYFIFVFSCQTAYVELQDQ